MKLQNFPGPADRCLSGDCGRLGSARLLAPRTSCRPGLRLPAASAPGAQDYTSRRPPLRKRFRPDLPSRRWLAAAVRRPRGGSRRSCRSSCPDARCGVQVPVTVGLGGRLTVTVRASGSGSGRTRGRYGEGRGARRSSGHRRACLAGVPALPLRELCPLIPCAVLRAGAGEVGTCGNLRVSGRLLY